MTYRLSENERAELLPAFGAAGWGAVFHPLGARGHVNADSGLGDWPEGHRLLLDLIGSPS